jgi:hypothetical protein
MLQRVICIRNVGRFKHCAAIGDVTFRRHTLIFADNARGKTTLCDVLRSLSENSPDIIVGRPTLGSIEPPEVQALTAGGISHSIRPPGSSLQRRDTGITRLP